MSRQEKTNALSVFSYQGNKITFQNENGNVMISAYQMAKSFGNAKRPQFWLNSQQANEFINELTKARNLALTDLVQVRRGGSNPGTWMHEDVALEFARWLSPAFAIWCNDRIKELLTQGVATISDDDDVIANAMLILQKRLDASKQQVQILESTVEHQQAEIKTLAPKAEYTDEVLQSTSTFTTTQIAKDLGMSAITLNKKLKDAGVQFYQSGQWMLYSKYQGQGLTDTRVMRFVRHDDTIGTNQSMVWTERGRKFIHQLQKGGAL